jgi:hypothetical protein
VATTAAPQHSPAGRMPLGSDTAFFGHPRGLSTLFFTEMWERFAYYGMRAILILYLTTAVAGGGLGYDVGKAGAVYGTYVALVYMLSLPGGWVADRILGLRKSVLVGGILIMFGQLCLAVPGAKLFYPASRSHPRHGPAQAEHQRHRRRPLQGDGRAPRRGLLDLLHGDQSRLHRAADRIGWRRAQFRGPGRLGLRPSCRGTGASHRRWACSSASCSTWRAGSTSAKPASTSVAPESAEARRRASSSGPAAWRCWHWPASPRW